MTIFMLPAPAGGSGLPLESMTAVVAAFLGRYRGLTRQHTASDLRCFLVWCADIGLDPLTARRAQLELFLRWMQDTRRFKPSTVSRRFSVVAGFYRTAVIDGVLDQSPAEHVRRPVVPPESPTLGLTHLQFEALLTTARDSANLNDFAPVAMLGLLGLRIFEATGSPAAPADESKAQPHPNMPISPASDRSSTPSSPCCEKVTSRRSSPYSTPMSCSETTAQRYLPTAQRCCKVRTL
jgi:hypothetical protein